MRRASPFGNFYYSEDSARTECGHTRLCLIGDSGSVHIRRWAEAFSDRAEILVISDSTEEIPGVRVEPVFAVKSKIRKLLAIPKMRRLIREFEPDIVHGHYLTVGGFYAATSRGKRIVGSAWGSDIYYGPEHSFIERLTLRFVLRRCDLVFAGTKDMADRIRKHGYDGDLRIFRFGVDPDMFKKASPAAREEFRILSIRPCSRIYNPLVIAEGFRRSLASLGNAYLYLFDVGNIVDEVRRAVSEDQALGTRVRFLGRTSYDQMPEVYGSADVAVSIPNSDSAAASVLEAMACEVPVIASDIPPMQELIKDGKNGYLCSITPDEVGSKLLLAHANRTGLPAMGRLARETILREDMQATFESNLRVAREAYSKLLSAD